MRAEFQAFRNYINQSTPCEFEGDVVSSPIASTSIDPETASSINYYKIEGRQATFNVPVNDEVYSLLLNRANYKNTLSPELTRIGVKIYNDNDEPLFFGVLAYGFTYDGYEETITGATVYDVIYIINKYWHKLYTSRLITSDDYSLTDIIEIALGTDENSPYKLGRYIPLSIAFNYLFDVNYSGFDTEGFITINSNWDVFYNDGQCFCPNGETEGVFGGYDDVDINDVFLCNTGYGYSQDVYRQLHRKISYGFINRGDRLEVVMMFYEYREEHNQPDQQGAFDGFGREKINLKSYIFTPGAQYQILYDISISRVAYNPDFGSDTYETMEANQTRLLDTEFFSRGYELKKEAYIDFLDDFYVISVVSVENTNLSGWNILFNGTVAQDIIRFNLDYSSDSDGNPITVPANLLAGAMLINNLTIQQDSSASDFSISINNKLKTTTALSSLTLSDSEARTTYTPMLISEYDPILLQQFIFGVSVESIINNYFIDLFNKYCVSKQLIFNSVSSLKIGNTITHDDKDYVIMELDRNYDNEIYKAICYGED